MTQTENDTAAFNLSASRWFFHCCLNTDPAADPTRKHHLVFTPPEQRNTAPTLSRLSRDAARESPSKRALLEVFDSILQHLSSRHSPKDAIQILFDQLAYERARVVDPSISPKLPSTPFPSDRPGRRSKCYFFTSIAVTAPKSPFCLQEWEVACPLRLLSHRQDLRS